MRKSRGLAGLRLAAAALLLAAGLGGASGEDRVPEPAGYRMDDYRAPTPATLAGAVVLDIAAAEALWRGGTAVFVDVLPRPEKPPNLPAGTVWHDKRRDDIPGSAWLANTGYGALSEAIAAYFATSLERLTGGRRDRPLVFYCLTDCWMSWNAAKRALALGYTSVHWMPDGSDGWQKAGLPLEEKLPFKPEG